MILTSISEERGIEALEEDDLTVYSIGISTAGAAEMRMAELHPKRYVTATTIDVEGAKFVREQVDAKGLSKQIAVKIEDVSEPLPYEDNHFDFIYARLVLHYLPRTELTNALGELYRVLKCGGRFYVVVRSTACRKEQPDPTSGLTSYSVSGESYRRHFHTEASIQKHLLATGFEVAYVKSYEEHLYEDFYRSELSPSVDTIIETLCSKNH
ncbi:MAG: hypothetical protein KR126chlam2_00747 [Chlamydiae bacterium]|nr:hypothetical protein [Chlamydiota bacterium]